MSYDAWFLPSEYAAEDGERACNTLRSSYGAPPGAQRYRHPRSLPLSRVARRRGSTYGASCRRCALCGRIFCLPYLTDEVIEACKQSDGKNEQDGCVQLADTTNDHRNQHEDEDDEATIDRSDESRSRPRG